MKKIIATILALTLVLSLSACGKTETAKEIDITQVKTIVEQSITDSGKDELMMFQDTNADFLSSMYSGIEDLEIENIDAWQNPVTGAAPELLVVQLKDAGDSAKLVEILEARIDSSANDTFYVENAGAWKNNAWLYENGSYVIMLCLPEGYEIPEKEITELFK